MKQQSYFPVTDNCLLIGGIPLTRLAQRVGRTPFFAYDRSSISSRVESLRRELPLGVRLHYSVKANPMPALVQHMAGLIDGFDVSSGSEMKIALDTALSPGRISFSGPGKSEDDLSQAIAAGAILNLESEREFRLAARIGDHLGIAPQVCLRINPDFELRSSGMRMGGGSRQFGVDAEEAPRILKAIGMAGMDFHGLHIFAGSQSLNSAAIIETHALIVDLALRMTEYAPCSMKLLNIGGGFGVPYFPGDMPLDTGAVCAHLAHCVERLTVSLPEACLALELGRYLVSEAGIYVMRIIDRKVSRGQTFLVADGGMHHHLAASGNLGQVIRKNYPVCIGNKAGLLPTEIASVVGPLCTPLDLLADKVSLPHAEVGDFIVVFQSGAYGLSASPVQFLGHSLPAEVFV